MFVVLCFFDGAAPETKGRWAFTLQGNATTHDSWQSIQACGTAGDTFEVASVASSHCNTNHQVANMLVLRQTSSQETVQQLSCASQTVSIASQTFTPDASCKGKLLHLGKWTITVENASGWETAEFCGTSDESTLGYSAGLSFDKTFHIVDAPGGALTRVITPNTGANGYYLQAHDGKQIRLAAVKATNVTAPAITQVAFIPGANCVGT
eukprot:GHVT01037334.1.p1 GENE.GHVT01037334.1~~GHVT01037334.1.p1  ORF type:complete len:209 (-),score=9.69 GHVT01037334.1:4445-5071(-)